MVFEETPEGGWFSACRLGSPKLPPRTYRKSQKTRARSSARDMGEPCHSRHCLAWALFFLAILSFQPSCAKNGSSKNGEGSPEAKVAQPGINIGGGGAGQGGQVLEMYDNACGAALVEKNTGNMDQAVELLGRAVSVMPNIAVGWIELGAIFGAVGDAPLAQRCLRSALRIDRFDKIALSLMHEIQSRGQLPTITPSIGLDSNDADPATVHQNRYKRRLYERYYMLDCRMRRLRQELKVRPNDVAALLGMAEVSSELLYHRQAVEMLQQALEVEPDNGAVFVKLVEAQVKGCVFKNWDANFQRLESFILQQAAAGKPVVLGPIQSTMYPLPPNVALAICKQAGDHAHALLQRTHQPFTYTTTLAQLPTPGNSPGISGLFWGGVNGGSAGAGGRLTVGYVTSHFTSSSIGREMLFLLGAHSESAVAAHCYALNADEGSWLQHTWRTNIAKACHKFVDASALDDAAAASAINKDAVHILIDLNGWSGGHRVPLISRGPAPIQVNYKNWVASSGIPALTHNIGDRIVCPPELQADYTEAQVLVANSYFISGHRYQYLLNNSAQLASEIEAPPQARAAARQQQGLPPEHFLVANFNNLDKLEPRLWYAWVGLLRVHPQAALWLQKYPPAKAARVLEMAKEDGDMDVSRLVMTGFFKSDHHIGIKALADVFLDNPTYNAHSTAMDTLWGALPFVSLPEEKMAARVGASLLIALESGWGVVRSVQDMSALVTRFIKRPQRFRRLRHAMQQTVTLLDTGAAEQARHWAPLFDTVRAVRNLEMAMRLMWEAHLHALAGRTRARPHIVCGDVGPISAVGHPDSRGGEGGAEGGVEVGQRSGRRWRRSCLLCELPLSTLSKSEGTCPHLTAIQQAFIERCYSLNTAYMEP